MTLFQLDPESGKCLAEKTFYKRTADGREVETGARDVELPGMAPDVLASDGHWVYLRDNRMDENGNILKPTVPHIYSPVGLLNGQWWFRTYWQWGTCTYGRYSGWHVLAYFRPSGRILATDAETVFGYGRRRVAPLSLDMMHTALRRNRRKGKAPKGANMTGPHLFRAYKKTTPLSNRFVTRLVKRNNNLAIRTEVQPCKVRYLWSRDIDIVVRAMVLSQDVLFVAGPKMDREQPLFDDPARPAALIAVDTEDGSTLFEYPLPHQPVFDGVIAASGNLFIAMVNGEVCCLSFRGHSTVFLDEQK